MCSPRRRKAGYPALPALAPDGRVQTARQPSVRAPGGPRRRRRQCSHGSQRGFSESCFAIDLLKESLPDRCRLVMLCRPERTALLQPPSSVRKISLDSFSPTETLVHLRDYYPNATPAEGDEFHRLTTGNPRVQGNALRGAGSYEAMMVRLGLVGVTVNSQIEQQLQDALNRLRDHLAPIHQAHVEAICVGLANLQPRIPLEILAAAAGVTTDAIRSFVSDLGWPLWLRESAVQFRDEPTETWFTRTLRDQQSAADRTICRSPAAPRSPILVCCINTSQPFAQVRPL